jgi:hypothetical protein
VIVAKNTSIEEKLAKFKIIWEKLKPVYVDQLERDRISLQGTINQYKKYFQPTTFEIMGKHYQEEVHSNVLKYLIEKKDGGYQFLSSILAKLKSENAKKVELAVSRNDYSVTREYSLDGKRVDLLIKSEDFYIAIENKIHARIHDVEEDLEQTQYYRDKLMQKFPQKMSIFILLDFKDEESSEHYEKLSYDNLLDILRESRAHFDGDRIFKEYEYLLFRLLNEIEEISIPELSSLSLSKTQSTLKELKYGSFRKVADF